MAILLNLVKKMGLEMAESLPVGFGEDWLCWLALNRLRTGVGRAKTVMRRWDYLHRRTGQHPFGGGGADRVLPEWIRWGGGVVAEHFPGTIFSGGGGG